MIEVVISRKSMPRAARHALHHIHDVAVDGEGQDQIRIQFVEGPLDGLGHAADHPQREIAVDASEHAAAQDDVGAPLFAEPRELRPRPHRPSA